MKIWRRIKKMDLGAPLLSWRHRAPNRFFVKIFTWLLGGFVFGILTAILVDWIGITFFGQNETRMADFAQNAARIVFFVVFIGGVINAFFRNVIFGHEFRIMEKGFVHMKPIFGHDGLARLFDERKCPFFGKSVYIDWKDVKEIKESEKGVVLVLKQDDTSIQLDTSSVLSLTTYQEDGVPKTKEAKVGKLSLLTHDAAFDREAQKTIVQKARHAKKMYSQKKSQ